MIGAKIFSTESCFLENNLNWSCVILHWYTGTIYRSSDFFYNFYAIVCFDIMFTCINALFYNSRTHFRLLVDIKVQWDEPSSILRPDKVSAWELEPLVASNPLSTQPTQRNKRPRPTVLPSSSPDATVLGNGTFMYSNNHC